MSKPLIIVSHHMPNRPESRNTMNPYHVVDSATVNGHDMQLRRLDTGDASSYVVVVNGTYANFGNKAHAQAAFDMATEAAYA